MMTTNKDTFVSCSQNFRCWHSNQALFRHCHKDSEAHETKLFPSAILCRCRKSSLVIFRASTQFGIAGSIHAAEQQPANHTIQKQPTT